MQTDLGALTDMRDSAALICQYVADLDETQFRADVRVQDAVLRRIEILGEAAKRLSVQLRESAPDIPWQRIAGMRDRVIHDYDSIDLAVVWDTASKEVPRMRSQIEALVNELERN